MALSSQVGLAALHSFGEGSGINSLHNRHGLEAATGLRPATLTEPVQLQTADAFFVEQGITQVDLMKIDTEGHEVDVLQGCRGALQKGLIKRIQFEYGGTYIDARRLLKDVYDIFDGLPYTVFLIAPNSLIARPKYDQRLENFQYKNFMVLREDVLQDAVDTPM
jgi:hypothetical protein